MADIAELGIKVDSRDVKQADDALDGLSDTAGDTEEKVRSSGKKMGFSFAEFSKVAVGAITAISASAVALGKSFADQTAELVNQARLANSTTEELQELAFAARTVGIDQDKTADILKDFNDRVGDFLQTGAGPMVDFFDEIGPKMGVTAEKLSQLSGVDGLQLFVKALEDSNLTQAEMIFQMEALSSESTALLPILTNNAKGFNELAEQARQYGLILDQETIANAIAFKAETRELTAIQDGLKNKIGAELLPTLSTFNQVLLDIARDTSAASIVADGLSAVLRGVSIAGIAVGSTLGNVGRAIGGLAAAAVQATQLNFAEAGEIINQFTRDNEEATRKAEEAMGKLWRNEGVKPPVEIQTSLLGINGEMRTLGRETEKADEAAKEAARSFDILSSKIADFEFAAATIGMSADEVARYELQLLGASETQLAYVESLQAKIAADEAERLNIENLNELMTRNEELITGVSTGARMYADTIAELNALLEAGRINQDEYNDAVGRAQQKFDEMEGRGASAFKGLNDLAKEAAKSSQGALSDFLFDPFDKGLDGMLDSFVNTMKRMAAEAASAAIMQGLLGMLMPGAGAAGAGAGGMFAGLFDSGGTIGRGQFGVVGERGPEIVRGPANVVGRHQTSAMMRGNGGGDSNVIVNITTPSGTEASVEKRQGPTGLNIDVTIDEIVANKINQSGSKTDRALKSKFGLKNQLANR